MHSICLVKDRNRWWALAKTVLAFRSHKINGNSCEDERLKASEEGFMPMELVRFSLSYEGEKQTNEE
jgi:hypothetical protein